VAGVPARERPSASGLLTVTSPRASPGSAKGLGGGAEVGAGAKGVAGTGHDGGPDGVVLVAATVRPAEAVAHRTRERVAPIGTAQGHDGHAVLDVEGQVREVVG
jgi:hypothetical protein